MTLWTLTLERKEALLKQRDDKAQELMDLQKKSPEDLWLADLDALLDVVGIQLHYSCLLCAVWTFILAKDLRFLFFF